MCGYRYISQLERSDPAFHSPVQYWFVQHPCELSSCASYMSVCWFLLDKFSHKTSTNWLTCLQTLVLMSLFFLMPYAKCVLVRFHDLNVDLLQCDVYSIQLKLKQLLARIAWYVVHVGWCALFYFSISEFYVSQSIDHYDHVPVKSAETFKSPGNSDECYNGCLLTRHFNEYICCN